MIHAISNKLYESMNLLTHELKFMLGFKENPVKLNKDVNNVYINKYLCTYTQSN